MANEGAEILSRITSLNPELRRQWQAPRKFPYAVIDDFLPEAVVKAALEGFPQRDAANWKRTPYAHQREKLAMESGIPSPCQAVLDTLNGRPFLDLLEQATGINGLLSDPDLVGGGLHQIEADGFLNVHVDFNFHPRKRLHRRMNLLVYLNPDWDDAWEGHLELWDMDRKERLERIAPKLNRAVLFETNEVSFHGHPRPLKTPPGVVRRSMALYYYTESRETVAPEHNTLYRYTSIADYPKVARATAQALVDRLKTEGVRRTGRIIATRIVDRILGRAPRNR
ncbi:MAG: 2OG-Fe(II) oxygenase [Archangium sp.]|nr:2OG-Fe(II) oxygenase [Archangium sp.]